MHDSTKNDDLLSAAAAVLRKDWGIEGTLERLPGENFNALVNLDGSPYAVVKLCPKTHVDVALEDAVLHRLASAGLPVPTPLPTRSGHASTSFEHPTGTTTARVQAHLPGTQWRCVPSRPRLLEDIGRRLAQLHLALDGFAPDGADRSHTWDLTRAQQHRPSVELVGDPELRQILDSVMQLHSAVVLPGLSECPGGLLHGDANDENLLIEDESVVGIVDFGDCLAGPYVVDLGITVAYAMQQDDCDLQSIAHLVGGYHAVRPLLTRELDLVVPIGLARLATSALIGAHRARIDPDHATWQSHADSTTDALRRFGSIAPTGAANHLRDACGHRMTPEIDRDRMLSIRRDRLGRNLSLAHGTPLHIVRGRGQFLIDSDGRPHLDLVNNVCHVGHCHPRVVEAISEQAARLNTNTRYLHESILRYAERLTATMPDPLSVCYFVNSGSEANELALRLARAATGSNDAVVVDGAYHGSTPNCVAMSPYKFNGKGGRGPSDWVHVIPMPDAYRGPHRGDDAGLAYALDAAETMGTACRNGRTIAGLFVESMLSCGGQIPLPEGYLAAVADHARHAGALYIADEVQVGFGRLGDAFWGFQLHDVVPDIVVLGKPMGNGHPMGAVVTTPEIAASFDNGMEFFSTFGGNPVSCRCGLAVLDVIEDESLQDQAARHGRRFKDGLHALRARHPAVGDVRGHGLFLGIDLVLDPIARTPHPEMARQVVRDMTRRGVLLSTDGPHGNVIKIKPPLVLTEADIDMTIRGLDDALTRFDSN